MDFVAVKGHIVTSFELEKKKLRMQACPVWGKWKRIVCEHSLGNQKRKRLGGAFYEIDLGVLTLASTASQNFYSVMERMPTPADI